MKGYWQRLLLLVVAGCFSPGLAFGQIDPVKRELVQIGYNAALQGHPPFSAYAFYYWNNPAFLQDTNLALRLALAPTYIDSEMGIRQMLGPDTDLGIGLSGGAFADSYYEIDQGKYIPAQSFDGYGGGPNLSLYHLFNPGQMIPLNGILRGSVRYVTYDETDQTAPNFRVPDSMGIFSVRSGLRWGGAEPTLFPALAMELSVWYQGDFRTASDFYGFNDRQIEAQSHLFWTESLLAYTLPEWKHSFNVRVTAGTSINADRLSAYRLGALLPMAAEFPLSLPGYFAQELSAQQFVLLGGGYTVPLDKHHRWNITANAATAWVDYLPGLEQPGHWNSGVGGGVFYTSPSWRVMVGYGYGIDAIRSSGRGAQSVGILLQFDFAHAKEVFYKPAPESHWRGLQRVIGVLGS